MLEEEARNVAAVGWQIDCGYNAADQQGKTGSTKRAD